MFVANKMIKTLYTDLQVDENIWKYFNENSNNIVFFCNKMDILHTDLSNINLDNNFDEDDPDTIIRVRRLAGHIKI